MMKSDQFDELLRSVREGDSILRGESEPSRITSVESITIHGIPVRARFDGERYFVSDDVIDLYGVGDTLDEARDDYWLAVQDAYTDLFAHSDHLAPYLQEQLAYLSRVFTVEEGVIE
ncbi:MAG: hypothetical protein GY759_06180 [Chloroflexi bacterium]|nr:hypothetical protein [Chloroflexota bacterium]